MTQQPEPKPCPFCLKAHDRQLECRERKEAMRAERSGRQIGRRKNASLKAR